MGIFKKKEPEEYPVLQQPLKCIICGHDRFKITEAQLNTKMASFVGLDWLNDTGQCAVCDKCGFIHWFLSEDSVTRNR